MRRSAMVTAAGICALAMLTASLTPSTAEDQAAAGIALYRERCSLCHGPDMQGHGEAPALAGQRFDETWAGKPAYKLYSKIWRGMPQDRPNSLTPEEAVDLFALLLKANGRLPQGQAAYPGDEDALRSVVIAP